MNAAQRSQRARLAALSRWAKEEPTENARRGQAGLMAKFLREVDTHEPGLPELERHRRARSLQRAHMTRVSHARRAA